ncbi:hypothetical protein BD779DRAFT_913203 [Infundibulicybe gibba]|nr:hypothetical protein BD779DRAFT_913203 [Infundibulicybe gibba]
MITTNDEIQVIWPKPWTPIKFLYFYIRYVPIIILISTLVVGADFTAYFGFTANDCYIWQVYQGIAVLLTIWATDLILILRVFAIYKGCPVVRSLLSTVFLGEVVCMSTGLGLTLPHVEYNHLCFIVDAPSILFIVLASPIVMQSLLFMLTSWKFVSAIRAGWGHVPLVVLLMRDGTWAFFMLFVILVGECLIYSFRSDGYSSILYGWVLAAFSFSGYRIILNINHLSQSPHYQTATSAQTSQFTTQIFLESQDTRECESIL